MIKRTSGIFKFLLVGLLSIGSLVALSACGDETGTEDVTQEPVTETPETIEEAPEATPEEMAGGEPIPELAATNDSLQTLSQAVEAAGLEETLSGEGPYTVFAPTDDAFAALPEGTLDELLQPENQDRLAEILSYHVVSGEVTASELESGEVETLAGEPLTVQVEEGADGITVNGAEVTQPNIEASNGVVHLIDQVVMPPES
jgi:uncharacterized surface protein with fasciclin (FAS1) repeats